MNEQKIYGSSQINADDNWHIEFRNNTLCARVIVRTVRTIKDATCPVCIERYKLITTPERITERVTVSPDIKTMLINEYGLSEADFEAVNEEEGKLEDEFISFEKRAKELRKKIRGGFDTYD